MGKEVINFKEQIVIYISFNYNFVTQSRYLDEQLATVNNLNKCDKVMGGNIESD